MPALFAATRRTHKIIGREKEMDTIHRAIFTGDTGCRVVLIQGRGGFGKTRLLEETLWRLNNPSERNEDFPMSEEQRQAGLDWSNFDRVVSTDIVDLIDTRLHARTRFLRAVRDSLRWAQEFSPEFNFNNFDAAITEHERRVLDNVEYRLTQAAAREAVSSFWEDYNRLISSRRIVWAIDTAEQLSVIASQWLVDNNLLQENQLQFQAQKWLINALRSGLLVNTTLLLAGREREAEKFFDSIGESAHEGGAQVDLIEARPFEPKEIQQYIETLAAEWRTVVERAGGGMAESPVEAATIAEAMETIASDPARVDVLHTYTGGQPVRLSLFADLIVESRTIPKALRANHAANLTLKEKERKQWELEEEIIRLLFSQPRLPQSGLSEAQVKQATLRRDILLALVRARQGLSASQLHYVIDNPQTLDPETWENEYSSDRVRQIAATMEQLKNLSIVKTRPPVVTGPDGDHMGTPAESLTLRLGLQDEIYRIFAEHMAPHVRIGTPLDDDERENRQRLDSLWEQFDESERARFQRNYSDEQQARSLLYVLLRDWAGYQRRKIRAQLLEIIEQEEQELENELYRVTPASPRSARLWLSEEEQERRIQLRQAQRELDLDYMHYAFLLDPASELNDAYFDLADEFWRANDEEADILTQAEMWRILRDRHALAFVDWGEPRTAVQKRGEAEVDVLRRAAIQEDASRWIKRLALRRQYREAVEFTDRLETFIRENLEGYDQISWQHTFADGERMCWREYSYLLSGQGGEIRSALDRLKDIAIKLEQLARCDVNTIAIPETGENGFIGHPGYIRLRRVISVIHANIAYGQTQLGNFRTAVEYYSKALAFVRETGAHAHRATVLNNLSRALSEMGRARGLRVCQDALGLRQRLGADAPIGLSHSTLALIFNDQNNPDRAWVEAAKAMLFFQRVDDPRGVGLASIQLGEALRRLAAQQRYGRALPTTREELYRAAESILNDALRIFTKEEPQEEASSQDRSVPDFYRDKGEEDKTKVREPVRWIEARIEKGCMYRDQVYYIREEKPQRDWRKLYSTALGLLNEAVKEARANGWTRLELDAQVNVAWTHYYAGELDKTLKSIASAKSIVGRILDRDPDLIAPGKKYPKPDTIEAYLLNQLSKIHGLRGRIALDIFKDWVKKHETTVKRSHASLDVKQIRRVVHESVRTELLHHPHYLDEAADAYHVAVKYAQLYSPRSTALAALFDTLYDYLKMFNEVELEAFDRLVRGHPLSRRKENLEIEDLGDLGEFLRESLGQIGPV